MSGNYFNQGDIVKFEEAYFMPEDLGMSGIVMKPDSSIYQDDIFMVVGHLQESPDRLVLKNERGRIYLTTCGFLEKIKDRTFRNREI